MGTYERAQLGDELCVASTLEVGVDPALNGGESKLVERRGFARGERRVDVGQRCAPEETIGLAQEARAAGQIRGRAGVGDERTEAVEVELSRLDHHEIPRRLGDEPVAQHLPQARDLVLQRAVNVERRDVPKIGGKPVDRNRPVRVDQQPREECTLARSSEQQCVVVRDGLDRAKDREVHTIASWKTVTGTVAAA
jgi:hypothetical protein